MSEKIQFGFDFITVMRGLMFKENENRDFSSLSTGDDRNLLVSNNAVLLFLSFWGLTTREIAQVDTMWRNQAEIGQLDCSESFDPFLDAAYRLKAGLTGNRLRQEQFIVQLSAIGYLDKQVTRTEYVYVQQTSDLFEFSERDFERLTTQGADLAIALDYYGATYAKTMGSSHFFPIKDV